MPVDLTPFGIPRKIEGRLAAARQEGQALLLLFNETHTDYGIIRQNLLNALPLIDGGFVGFVGVEGEYSFEEYTPDEIVAESRSLYAQHQTDQALIDFFAEDARDMDRQQPDVPHFFFGTCLKLLRPSITIRRVDDVVLADAAERVQWQFLTDFARESNLTMEQVLRLLRDRNRPEALEHKMHEFRTHEINLRRDAAMLSNMLRLWQEVGVDRAAILNGGTAHMDRIATQLPPDAKFVQVFQPVSFGGA